MRKAGSLLALKADSSAGKAEPPAIRRARAIEIRSDVDVSRANQASRHRLDGALRPRLRGELQGGQSDGLVGVIQEGQDQRRGRISGKSADVERGDLDLGLGLSVARRPNRRPAGSGRGYRAGCP